MGLLSNLSSGLANSPLENLEVGAPLRGRNAFSVNVPANGTQTAANNFPLPLSMGRGTGLLVESFKAQITAVGTSIGISGGSAQVTFADAINPLVTSFFVLLGQITATGLNVLSPVVVDFGSGMFHAVDMQFEALTGAGALPAAGSPAFPFAPALQFSIGLVNTSAGIVAVNVVYHLKARFVTGLQEG